VSRAERLTAGIGGLGWAGAAVLGATVLVGRSGPLPSLRWLGAALLSAAVLGAVAALAGPPADAPPASGAAGAARKAQPWHLARPGRLGRQVCVSLVLLALCLPLIPVLYVDDAAYHHVGGGAAAGRPLLLYLLGLTLAGAVWGRARALQGGAPAPTIASVLAGRLPAVPVLAVTVMVGLNYGLFGALQGRLPVTPQTVVTLAGSLVLAAVAAAVGVGAFGGPALGAVAVWTAWLAFASWRESLAGDLRPALALALGATGLALLARRRDVPAGAVLGLLGLLVPASLGSVVALALLGRRRAALAGVGSVAGGAILLALAAPDALPAPPGLAGAAGALAGTPQLQNAALGAFHARLFLGPESLAGEGPPPLSLPAFALSLGALVVGVWLAGRAVWSARGAGPTREAAAVCLAMVAGLLLAGTTPRAQLVPAMLVLLPLGGRLSWAVAGYVFAATSVPALATAAAPILSSWPPLASAPVLGLALLTLMLALAVSAPDTTSP
jgi:hypothetical protein